MGLSAGERRRGPVNNAGASRVGRTKGTAIPSGSPALAGLDTLESREGRKPGRTDSMAKKDREAAFRCECCGEPIEYEDFLGCWIHADGEDHGHNVETSEPTGPSLVDAPDVASRRFRTSETGQVFGIGDIDTADATLLLRLAVGEVYVDLDAGPVPVKVTRIK